MAVVSKKIPAPDKVKIRTALLSVSDKTDIIELATVLSKLGVKLLSTGGTAKAIADAGLPVTDVSDVTNFPEIMDGRVKTLHPNVHGGLLAIRDDADHVEAMKAHGIEAIDLSVINLYPFEEVRAKGGDYPTTVENIDIGGPAMIRASAKNHAYVTVVTDPSDYPALVEALQADDGQTSYALRQTFAAKAYARTAAYDAVISNWFAEALAIETPDYRAIGGALKEKMRYGENPHQSAGFYLTGEKRPGVSTATLLQGKQLSYNNINDTDAAYELVAEFLPENAPAVAIIKHANPCGVATGPTLAEAYRRALACDSVSAFGGVIALNRTLDAETAEEIVKLFTEVIIAPDVTEEAKSIIARKPNLRLLEAGGLPDPRAAGITAKTVSGGLLVQSRDNGMVEDLELKVVTKRVPTPQELEDMKFAFKIAKHVKSNAVIYAKDGQTAGIGAGQMSRVDSARIAAQKAEDAAKALGLAEPLTRGSAVASEAFYPFADGLLAAIAAGATAVIQPGGSMRDQDVIDAANEHNVAMVFTGMRHFRH
ncbi:Bifunctional purine biosynthesis protein purH (Includes: Phosphoribosylaminoimidazolecarboxamide formyltransferase (AICAR transformylase); IMP cyclohydrolase (Inosinicase) (IMP synthetase) (ATIC)) [Agrobacterium fabacearum CFBP 5771]|uniref:bifunctional phosphoribosylaminoimidazolecarboxamide formyltransferase/IMP cyclohydrolase n=1 Tax=Rhizobium/Agrobacterium group TaxID=227290 RepID=UPI0004707BC7|nr:MULTISPECIES: bifunctional phosphoribosylaminoimidazolecarboxamide formyltransferase/IMP cyclohydrolase [Rhizobium/Agrobacterium group]KQY43452.1 phosphoribosylaminoimidazolecarboxamide formyltransferase [Rhizobium sp. Root491]MDR5010134.1 bifunctional phosphoribosylaminoimidazolecarboxamide formyltransferase/IMP cyclohydrolase [Agrobacterium tumefaciens]NSY59819.1 bifunctional phosphoribosylaminoimidazolecarboxamide formyltransferase/IMP cyclohydrolase [Agrobacterium tumefaciens]NTZ61332.1 